MVRLNFFSILLLLSLSFINAQPAPFTQGQINYFVENSKGFGSAELQIGTAGALAKVKLSLKQMNLNLDLNYLYMVKEPRNLYQIDHESKSYIKHTFNETTTKTEPLGKVTVKSLGDDVIQGYKVKGYRLVESGQTTEVWLAENIKVINFMNNFQKGVKKYGFENSAYEVLQKKGYKGFPLKVKHQYMGEVTTMEVTKITPKTMNASLYNIPNDYQRAPEAEDVISKLKGSGDLKELEKVLKENMSPDQIESLKKLMQESLK